MSAANGTMAEQAYDFILRSVLRRELKPGDWVDRRRIARELNASLMPVGEAVQRLTAEGFLVSVPRRGTQVRVPSIDDVRGQLLVRMALECQCARLYCGDPVRDSADRLRRLAEKADSLSGTGAWDRDLAFHRALVALADCPALEIYFDRIMNLALFQHTAILTPYALNRGDSHLELLEDLCTTDPDAAEARMRKHIHTGKEAFLEIPRPATMGATRS